VKLTRRGLFKAAGAVVAAPVMKVAHSVTKARYGGSFHLAFYISDGAKVGDEMVLHLYRHDLGPDNPAYAMKLPLEDASWGGGVRGIFEIQPHFLRGIHSGAIDCYRVYVTVKGDTCSDDTALSVGFPIRKGPTYYNYLVSEGWIYVYGNGPDDWAVRTSPVRLKAHAFKEYRP
jgi:hypothetical protein